MHMEEQKLEEQWKNSKNDKMLQKLKVKIDTTLLMETSALIPADVGLRFTNQRRMELSS